MRGHLNERIKNYNFYRIVDNIAMNGMPKANINNNEWFSENRNCYIFFNKIFGDGGWVEL